MSKRESGSFENGPTVTARRTFRAVSGLPFPIYCLKGGGSGYYYE